MRPRPGACVNPARDLASAIRSLPFPRQLPKSWRTIGKCYQLCAGCPLETIRRARNVPKSRRGRARDQSNCPSRMKARSNREIAGRFLVLKNMGGDRVVTEIIDRDRVEIDKEGFARLF